MKWTPLGAHLLTDEEYKYGSVEIGPVVLNDSGDTVDNVLRSLTLTNTPVLRLMPGVQNAAEKQRAVVTLSLSEVTLTTTHEDPDGSPVEPASGSSDDHSQTAKDDEGHHEALTEGDPVPKGSDHMKSVALKLALAEDASEETILAEVVKLAEHDAAETERANAAEAKVVETEKAASMAAFTAALDEKIEKDNTIATGERGFYVEMAEEHLALAEKAIAQRTVKVIDLSEKGSDSEGAGSEYADPSVELAEKSRIRAAKDGSTFDAASKLVLAEEPELKTRYMEWRTNPGKEA